MTIKLLPDSLIPADDTQRLRSLHHYHILNTTPEPIFDEYVALTAQLFNLPISLISLVDAQEVFFKANTGLPGLERVARPDSLCSAAILQNQVLTFTDLAQEGCSLINPAVAQSAGLRFYAGAVLQMPDGSNVGSLCVIGREARPMETEEEELLMEMAQMVSLTIELRATYLHHHQAAYWEDAQRELREQLHENAAFARYLTNRVGTISTNVRELAVVQRRLKDMRALLNRLMAEAASLES